MYNEKCGFIDERFSSVLAASGKSLEMILFLLLSYI